jgi:UDP-glucose 4-epimerase
VYGEGQRTDRGQGAVAAFLSAMSRGEPVTIYGDGRVVRDFVHVNDVAAATASLRPVHPLTGAGHEVVNIGSGIGVSLCELLSLMEELLGVTAEVTRLPSRAFDVERNVLAIDRLVELTGLLPMTLRDGLNATITAELGSGVS